MPALVRLISEFHPSVSVAVSGGDSERKKSSSGCADLAGKTLFQQEEGRSSYLGGRTLFQREGRTQISLGVRTLFQQEEEDADLKVH